jgi:hypothetical protein
MPDANGKSAGFIGYKARLSRSTAGNAGPWTAVPETKSFNPGEVTVDEAEFTHLESPLKRREFKPTFSDGGTMTVVCNYLDTLLDAAGAAVQTALIAAVGIENADFYWKIEWKKNDETGTVLRTVIFPGYVSSAKPPDTTTTDPVEFNFSVRISGAEAWS